jgi:SAM-dependent methyltransferase
MTSVVTGDRSPEVVIGQLWAELTGAGPLTATELAARTRLNPALVREWCRAQAAAGYLAYSPAGDTFMLTDGVAGALVHGPGGAMVEACTEMLCSLGAGFEEFTEAFRAGDGYGWHRHDSRFWHGSDALTRVALPAELISAVLDQLGTVTDALRAGATAIDVGSGWGSPTIAMARHFPAARFTGIDYHDPSVQQASARAREAGVADRVRFEVGSALDLPGSEYALVTFFDSLHDLGEPLGALVEAREALAEDGAVLLVEPLAADRVEDNPTASGRMFYAVSTLVCTPNALSQIPAGAGPEPLGTQAGEALLRATASAAGFSRVRRIAVDAPLNLVLELRA